MKLIVVVALLVCLLAINADGLTNSRRYWMYWRSTTLCVKTAASQLSKCPGVRTNFRLRHNWTGGRAIENEGDDIDQPENADVVSAREVYETVDAVDKAGNSIHSIRQSTE